MRTAFFLMWLAVIALLMWVNASGRPLREWMDADSGEAAE